MVEAAVPEEGGTGHMWARQKGHLGGEDIGVEVDIAGERLVWEAVGPGTGVYGTGWVEVPRWSLMGIMMNNRTYATHWVTWICRTGCWLLIDCLSDMFNQENKILTLDGS
jgi:hypothetical protein